MRLTDVDPKHPGASKLYTVDWSPQLNSAATISTSTWAVPAPLTKVADSSNGTTTSIQLSGGADGSDYVLVNTITTSDGETLALDCPLTVRR